MCMIIHLFIYIEWTKCIQRIMGHKFKLAVNIPASKNWDEVRALQYSIKMNNSEAVRYRTNNPHSHIFVWFISHTVVPTDECTWVLHIFKCEWKQLSDVSNLQPPHALKGLVTVHQHCIIMRGAPSPQWHCTYALATHATNSTQITWHKESWDHRMVKI